MNMTRKLNERVKKLWLAALRSGKYEQGVSYLNRNGNYCCLGVLCEVAIKDGLAVDIGGDEYGFDDFISYDRMSSVPPLSVDDWAGLQMSGVNLDYKGNRYSLMALNDKMHLDFNEIADLVEAQL